MGGRERRSSSVPRGFLGPVVGSVRYGAIVQRPGRGPTLDHGPAGPAGPAETFDAPAPLPSRDAPGGARDAGPAGSDRPGRDPWPRQGVGRRRACRWAGAPERPPGPALGRIEARGPRRAPGDRRRRQGRHDPARHGRVQPAGLPASRRSRCPRPIELAHDYLWRVHSGRRRGARSGSSTARTTRTCSSCGSTTSFRRRSGRSATTRSTTSRSASPRAARRS